MSRILMLVAMIVLGCSACGNVDTRMPVRSSEAEAAFQLVEAAEDRQDDTARAELERALAVFEGLDDRPGRWSASMALANWYLARRELATALMHARQALTLAPQSDSVDARYRSALLMGQLTNDVTHLRDALSHARAGLQKAVVLVLLDDHTGARQALADHEDVSDNTGAGVAELAFVLYRLGKHEGDGVLLLEALDHYRLAADMLGVTDSLFLLARLERDQALASDYATRALLSARQSGDAARIDTISRWLDATGSSQ